MSEDQGFFQIAQVEGWIAIDLSLDHAACVEYLLGAAGGTAAADSETRAIATGLADLAAQVREQSSHESETNAAVVALWAMFEDDAPDPVALAMLRFMQHPAHDIDALVADLTRGDALWEQPAVEIVQTGSGPAFHTRVRPVVTVPDDEADRPVAPRDEVHEQSIVAWLRPDRGFVVVLSSYYTDLVLGMRIHERLPHLAHAVTGL